MAGDSTCNGLLEETWPFTLPPGQLTSTVESVVNFGEKCNNNKIVVIALYVAFPIVEPSVGTAVNPGILNHQRRVIA